MASSVYEIWLSADNGDIRLSMPVLPATLDIGNTSKNESVDISNLGEVTILQKPGAKTFGFSSFFPKNRSPVIEYGGFIEPWKFVEFIEGWINREIPVRFVVTGTPINYAVSIEEFNYDEEHGAVGDLNYTISLKEFKFVKMRKITEKKKEKARPKPKPKGKMYAIKKGDTLWALARKNYGKGSEWRKIWNANKAAIIKRDKRNNKQPGHWIHIGEKIVIPA